MAKRFSYNDKDYLDGEVNNCDNSTKVDFSDIYSDDPLTLRGIFAEISKVWNLHNANGTMNVTDDI